jgi:hypothetical protein
MALIAFNSDLPIEGRSELKWEISAVQSRPAEDITRAITYLSQHKFLSHTFGLQGEWEVRTILLTNRQPWRYHSTVLVHGKEASREFSPVKVDQARHIQRLGAVTEEMIAAFTREAAEVHFARCASVADYSLMTSIFSQPTPRLQHFKKAVMVLVGIVVLMSAYWWWRDTGHMGLEQLARTLWSARDSQLIAQPQAKLAQHVRWKSTEISHQLTAGESFEFTLPALEGVPAELPVNLTLEASGNAPRWLELDRARRSIHGTVPVTAAGHAYRLSEQAHTEAGGDSRLLIRVTIADQHDRITPSPQLRGHWTW